MPKNYDHVQLGMVGDLFQGLTIARHQNAQSKPVYVFNPAQLKTIIADLETAVQTPLEISNRGHCLQPGDVLLTIRNRPLKSSVYQHSEIKSVAGQNVAVLRPKSQILDSIFLAAMLRSDYGKTLLEPHFSRSATVPQISLSALRNVPISLPPLETQQHLAALMLAAERAEHADLERIQTRHQIIEATLFKTLGSPS
jgi:Type I restriction modification DNA specificity domain